METKIIKSTNTSNKKTSSTFYTYLDKYRSGPGETKTHTSMGYGIKKGSFNIPDKDSFYKKYHDAVFNLNEEVNLIEQHSSVGPIIIDIDMKFKLEETSRLYTIDHLKKLVKEYISEIVTYFDISKSDDRIKAFIFERDDPYTYKTNVKDGIHIMFPFIISKPDIQYIIRENIIKKCSDIFEDLPLKNKYIEVIDRAVISKNGWFMYGSTKPNRKSYKLTHIYNNNIKDEDINKYSDLELVKLLKIRYEKSNIKTRTSKLGEIEKIINKTYKIKSSKVSRSKLTMTDILKIKDLIKILSSYRADDYLLWIELGWCLHNIDPYSEEILKIWIEFSKQSNKYEEGECEKRWDNFKDGNFTIATLYYWAKIDNPEKYSTLQRGNVQFFIEKSINSTNYDIAVVLFNMFRYQYCCASVKNRIWYEYRNHKWVEVDDGISIRQKISTDLVDEYCRLISIYNEKSQIDDDDMIDEEEREEYLRKSKVLSDIILKLKTTKFKDNIMKESTELFYNRLFYKKLDTNLYLIGFNNGVYDLKRSEFRDGKPDDYISISTNNDYIDYDEDCEEIHEINTFLSQVLPQDNIKEYVMTLLSSFLEGHNADEKFNIWTGSGCHSIDTNIMMFNGKYKKVQDIEIGEYLMGDDNTKRVVKELFRGKDEMYEIIPYEGGKPFIVNQNHILSLKIDTIIYPNVLLDISVIDYIKSIKNSNDYYLYKQDGFRSKFSIKYIGKDNYYGFELSGNHRYVMNDLWITHNSNGKSKITQLFELSFGDYCITFPITLITGKRAASNSATPEIAQSKGKRFGIFQEPSDKEKINIGLMKQLTGNDKIKARPLFKDPIEFVPQFKLLLVCNHMPSVPAEDEAVWRRLEVVEYTSKFVDDPNPNNEHEFEKDKYLIEKLDKWKEHFISLLINVYYKSYKKHGGLNIPDEVKKYTQSFQKKCDSLATFFDIISYKTNNKSDLFDLSEVYEEYKIWYADYYGFENQQKIKILGKKEYSAFVKRYFAKSLLKKNNTVEVEPKFLIGYKRRTESEDDDNNNDQQSTSLSCSEM